jgi:hypothetical protein
VVPRITKEDLKQRLDSGTPLVLVDARLKYPYEHSTVRLPGAVRYRIEAPTPSFPRDREIVVYDSDPNEFARAWRTERLALRFLTTSMAARSRPFTKRWSNSRRSR